MDENAEIIKEAFLRGYSDLLLSAEGYVPKMAYAESVAKCVLAMSGESGIRPNETQTTSDTLAYIGNKILEIAKSEDW
jgi:hypothetical protein